MGAGGGLVTRAAARIVRSTDRANAAIRRFARLDRDWRGQVVRRSPVTVAQALALADAMRRTRRARGGKAGDSHYGLHRAMERLAREVRRLRAAR